MVRRSILKTRHLQRRHLNFVQCSKISVVTILDNETCVEVWGQAILPRKLRMIRIRGQIGKSHHLRSPQKNRCNVHCHPFDEDRTIKTPERQPKNTFITCSKIPPLTSLKLEEKKQLEIYTSRNRFLKPPLTTTRFAKTRSNLSYLQVKPNSSPISEGTLPWLGGGKKKLKPTGQTKTITVPPPRNLTLPLNIGPLPQKEAGSSSKNQFWGAGC